MTYPCDLVAERIALGEPLGEFAEHASDCESCRRVVAVAGALSNAHRDVDPGLGFSARMTVGARKRIAERRRFRVVTGLAATVAAGALGVVLFTHHPVGSAPVAQPLPATNTDPQPVAEAPTPAGDDDLAALAAYADVDSAMHEHANWKQIEEPLAAYAGLMTMMKGVTP